MYKGAFSTVVEGNLGQDFDEGLNGDEAYAGLVRSPLDEILAIRTLLADVYKDAGDGRTLVRELVQNADDAGATRLAFAVLDRGYTDAQNSLLRGPALLVANDGAFSSDDRAGIHRAIGGTKEEDADKIGTFGIGLKSVFHICEAFVYLGARDDDRIPGVLNPWAGTGGGSSDPVHADWDSAIHDQAGLLNAAASLLGEPLDDFLLLWIPLRIARHLDRSSEGTYGLGQRCPTAEEVAQWFARRDGSAMLLAQCGTLAAISAVRALSAENLSARRTRKLFRTVRSAAGQWVGRPTHDNESGIRDLGGDIDGGEAAWTVAGVESLGHRELRALRSRPEWPSQPRWVDGRFSSAPRKGLAHAAVSVLRPVGGRARLGVRLRWAVFLPLDDHPESRAGSIVERLVGPSPAWEILLHGYFWPSQDRRSIPGVTDDRDDSVADMRVLWNRGIRDKMLLPLLPEALARAVRGVEESVSGPLIDAVAKSSVVEGHSSAVIERAVLLPVVGRDGMAWGSRPAENLRVFSIPGWRGASEAIRVRFDRAVERLPDNVVFIDHDAPRLAPRVADWPQEYFEHLLSSIGSDEFGSTRGVRWLERVVANVCGLNEDRDDALLGLAARWIATQMGAGVLSQTEVRSPGDAGRDSRIELREAWVSLLGVLDHDWLVEAPLGSQQAVSELAAQGVFGEGLMPVPFGTGRQRAETHRIHADQAGLDRALNALGDRLAEDCASSRLRQSRLVLAEALLAVRDGLPDGGLESLPLVRVYRLPAGSEDAWSIRALIDAGSKHRAFTSPFRDGDGEGTRPVDPREAARDLADALGEDVWFATASRVAVAADTPTTDADGLATAVLRAERFAGPAGRRALTERLGLAVDKSNSARQAVRTLLVGQRIPVAASGVELLAPTSERERRSLELLLGIVGQPWRLLERQMLRTFSEESVELLRVRLVNSMSLQRLVQRAVDDSAGAWDQLDEDSARHLLGHLFMAARDRPELWERIPLHRFEDGSRGVLEEGVWRAGVGLAGLPGDLRKELRILKLDSAMADLYEAIPVLDEEGCLQAMLSASDPHRFAEPILAALPRTDGHVSVSTERVRGLLRDRPWLPSTDGTGISPGELLLVPRELVSELAELRAAGALCRRLQNAVEPEIWASAEPVVRDTLGRPSRTLQIRRIVEWLRAEPLAACDDGAWLIAPCADCAQASLVVDGLLTPLAGVHRGWRLLGAVNNLVRGRDAEGEGGGNGIPLLVVEFAGALCRPVPPAQQVTMLKALAESRPPKDSPGGRAFRGLVGCFAKSSVFFENVLPELDLPTQDGGWRPAHLIARTESGVGRRHRLIAELRSPLVLDGLGGARRLGSAGVETSEMSDRALERYLEPWRGRVPDGAVGALVSLLGRGLHGSLARLAEQWCGDDISVEKVREEMVGDDEDVFAGLSVWVSPHVASGDRVYATNLLGADAEMAADEVNETLFAVDPARMEWARYSALAPLGPFWELRLRAVALEGRTTEELLDLLGSTVERWTVGFLGLERERVREWWRRWGRTSQAYVGPVRASILAKLPLTLHQLGVRDCEPLRVALREAEAAQRRREQMRSQGAMDVEKDALARLAESIGTAENATFLAGRVRATIEQYGYGAESVLLELAQNADDALAQAAEIRGGGLPRAACRFEVRVHEVDGTATLDVTHWGRPVNEAGGSAFPEGREREWDQDLYFMMLMNLSSKPGETGRPSEAATTGRFGLGFKSVHLISSCPSVSSGFVAFSIAGGLLPEEQPIAEDGDLVARGMQKPTRVRLPLRREAADDMARLFRRFDYAAFLLPVFARRLREIEVEGGPSPTRQAFDGVALDGAPGWSVGSDVRMPHGGGRWRIVRFKPADAGTEAGTAALAFGVQDGMPKAFRADLPFLWNVAPTSESWACGYAVNGPWKLDPGRSRVEVDNEVTLSVAVGLGTALGLGLIALHDRLEDPDGELRDLLGVGDASLFLGSLWRLLAAGLGVDDDPQRRKFLHSLHGNGKGLSAWMGARSVVPSGLSAPFPPVLPAIDDGMRVDVAGDIAEPELCAALRAMSDTEVASVVSRRCVVSRDVAQLLRPLLRTGSFARVPMGELHLDDVLREVVDRWERKLTPERLHALRPLVREGVWHSVGTALQSARWRSGLVAGAADGTTQLLRNLLLRTPPTGWKPEDEDVADELLRAAMAPDGSVLAPSFVECPEDWKVFRWLRERHGVNAVAVAEWYPELPEVLHGKALRYLLHGNLGNDVLELLIAHSQRLPWLKTYENVRALLDGLGEDPWRCQGLLGSLFPDRFAPEPPAEPPVISDDGFFERLVTWWDDDAERDRVVRAYEKRAWPSWLRAGDLSASLLDDSAEHWLALLVLGACRGIGRTKDVQHRSFLEQSRSKGWWDVFRSPDDTGRWMGMLRAWQDEALERSTYVPWMSLFPTIYQFSRYLDVYRRLLQSAGRRKADQYRVTSLLAPRVDEQLTGAGSRFDAPPAPLHLGLHWVLRELVRLRVIDGEHLYADCWVPSGEVVRFLRQYGLELADATPPMEKAQSVADFMAEKTGADLLHLHHAFDIPIRHVATHDGYPVRSK